MDERKYQPDALIVVIATSVFWMLVCLAFWNFNPKIETEIQIQKQDSIINYNAGEYDRLLQEQIELYKQGAEWYGVPCENDPDVAWDFNHWCDSDFTDEEEHKVAIPEDYKKETAELQEKYLLHYLPWGLNTK